MKAQNAHTQAELSPQDALNLLQEGNQRFLDKKQHNRDLLQQVSETGGGQWPFAVVLSCIDSRVPAEIVFDQGIGDIFSARVAGNCVNPDLLGSIEYGINVAGSKLIVVLGHTHCGAIKGAIDAAAVNKLGMTSLNHLLTKFESSVQKCLHQGTERTSADKELVNNVVHENVRNVIEDIKNQSPTLKEKEANQDIKIVGAVYDVETGKVNFL